MTHEEILANHSKILDGSESIYYYPDSTILKAMAEAVEADNKELVDVITEMQKYWDENGYECSPIINLQRIHDHALAACTIYREQLAAKDRQLKIVAELVDIRDKEIAATEQICHDHMDTIHNLQKELEEIREGNAKASITYGEWAAEKNKEIAELKEAAENLVQLKIRKDRNGKDEHYLKSVKPAWDNLKNLITK